MQTPPDKISVGDIIQYWRAGGEAPTIHRVIEINRVGGTTYIVTKGDANTAPDEPITATRTLGKVILVIPKIRWINMYLKTAATIWAFLPNNKTITTAIIALTLTHSAFRIHKHRTSR